MNPHANEALEDATASSYAEAVGKQEVLRSCLISSFPCRIIRTVAGADVAFDKKGKLAIGAVALFTWPELELVDMSLAMREVTFPYIPGLLSFREIPVLLDAFSRLVRRPDVVFCDGQGRAHPRRFGFACHLGVVLDLPTIGCAKSVLVGEHEPVGCVRGSSSALVHEGEEVGRAVRTRNGVEPMYISPGHLMDLETAVELVLEAGRGYRLPEPTRRAHGLVTQAKSLCQPALSEGAEDA
jgi:deoxyribonuclease V